MVKIFSLQLFADGAADGGAQGSVGNSLENNSGEGQTADAEAVVNNSSAAGDNEGAKANERDFNAEFDNLIKGDYKAQFDAKVQDIINRRFKAQRDVMDELSATRPIIDMLSQKYGTSDMASLKEAFKNDSALWEASAEAEGLEVDQYREVMQLRAENERYRRQNEMTERQRYVQQQIDNWNREGEGVKAEYEGFDLQTELQNKDFQGLLKAGIPMKMAYELIHSNEIKEAIREETKKTVMDNIRANNSRPSENGLKGSNGFVLGKDVSAMTKEDRDEVKRRVSRGEKVVL